MVKINPSQLVAFDFSVYGFVQGVHFRYYTLKFAQKFNLVGWVQNTLQGSVIGHAEGSFDNLSNLQYFLSHKGSPHSRIDRLELKNCRLIDRLEFNEFFVKKTDANININQNDEQSEISRDIEDQLKELGKLKYESQS